MELAKIFTDDMVFQANKPLRFFGTGTGKISVVLGGKTYEKQCDKQDWVMELPAQPYGGPFDVQVKLQDENLVLKNVAFGEVFLCAGQSNMQFTVAEEKHARAVKDNKYIRYFVSDRVESHNGQKTADGWTVCENGNARLWSALGFHIAEYYQEKHNVFVGIVGCFQGASVIRSWIPESYLDESVYIPIEERHTDCVYTAYSAWNGDSVLYKKTFLPIAPFSFKSVVWYQGESDTSIAEGKIYTQLLSKMISSWREVLIDSALPFVVVEICDLSYRNDDGWRAIQNCQQAAAKLIPNVVTVTSKDVCEHTDIHPSNKEKLAEKIVCLL